MVFQWGVANSDSTAPYNYFPVVFDTDIFSITFGYANLDWSGDVTYNNICWGKCLSKTGFNLYSPWGSGVYYIVIGY